jgi:hypothetical protein
MEHKIVVGGILVPVVVGAAGWVYTRSSPSNSITSIPNNTGIVTQGQTGNNIIVPFSTPEPESTRRNVLLQNLRQEYILSHDGLSPALLAGTEPVPADWMNKRLEQMGQSWRVRVNGSEYQILPPNSP